MNEIKHPVPSVRTLIMASLIAITIAVLVLIFFVLPAEYDFDPTGIGQKMGLTVLAGTNRAQATATPLPPRQSSESPCPEQSTSTSRPDTVTEAEPQWQDSVKIVVPARQGLEYKFHLAKDAPLEYSWSTDGPEIYFDFHGEPKGDKTGYFKSFEVSTDKQSSGILHAPFEGSHGWYWENNSRTPITIILNTKGSYRIIGLL